MKREQIYPQEPQCNSAALSHRLPSEVPKGGVYSRGREGASSGVSGNQRALRDRISRDWGRRRSRAFSRPVGADVESNEDSANDQELDRRRDIRAPAEREGGAMGRGVLEQRLLYDNCRQAWE